MRSGEVNSGRLRASDAMLFKEDARRFAGMAFEREGRYVIRARPTGAHLSSEEHKEIRWSEEKERGKEGRKE